jgi:hypothetical protein
MELGTCIPSNLGVNSTVRGPKFQSLMGEAIMAFVKRIAGAPALWKSHAAGLVLAASLFLTTAPAALAALVSENSVYGANTLTLDTNTGLEWLDVTLTQGQSINTVSSLLGAGQQFAGFRYAFRSELHTLILDGGVSAEPLFFSTAAGNVTAVANLISLLGQTFTQDPLEADLFGTLGWTGDHGFLGPDDAERGNIYIQRNCGNGPCATAQAFGFAQASGLDLAIDTTGSFLVRSAVPEPSTWAMMILGFAGVGFMAYRRSRKDQGLALAAA